MNATFHSVWLPSPGLGQPIALLTLAPHPRTARLRSTSAERVGKREAIRRPLAQFGERFRQLQLVGRPPRIPHDLPGAAVDLVVLIAPSTRRRHRRRPQFRIHPASLVQPRQHRRRVQHLVVQVVHDLPGPRGQRQRRVIAASGEASNTTTGAELPTTVSRSSPSRDRPQAARRRGDRHPLLARPRIHHADQAVHAREHQPRAVRVKGRGPHAHPDLFAQPPLTPFAPIEHPASRPIHPHPPPATAHHPTHTGTRRPLIRRAIARARRHPASRALPLRAPCRRSSCHHALAGSVRSGRRNHPSVRPPIALGCCPRFTQRPLLARLRVQHAQPSLRIADHPSRPPGIHITERTFTPAIRRDHTSRPSATSHTAATPSHPAARICDPSGENSARTRGHSPPESASTATDRWSHPTCAAIPIPAWPPECRPATRPIPTPCRTFAERQAALAPRSYPTTGAPEPSIAANHWPSRLHTIRPKARCVGSCSQPSSTAARAS